MQCRITQQYNITALQHDIIAVHHYNIATLEHYDITTLQHGNILMLQHYTGITPLQQYVNVNQ